MVWSLTTFLLRLLPPMKVWKGTRQVRRNNFPLITKFLDSWAHGPEMWQFQIWNYNLKLRFQLQSEMRQISGCPAPPKGRHGRLAKSTVGKRTVLTFCCCQPWSLLIPLQPFLPVPSSRLWPSREWRKWREVAQKIKDPSHQRLPSNRNI